SRLEIADDAEREVPDVLPPEPLPADPRLELLCEHGKVKKEVVRLPEDRRRPVDPRPRVDQVGRVELVPAVVALVAAGLRIAADRARSLDVSVGQGVPGRGGERDELLPLDDVPALVERAKEVARDCSVVAGRRTREEVVRTAEGAQILEDRGVVAIGGLSIR